MGLTLRHLNSCEGRECKHQALGWFLTSSWIRCRVEVLCIQGGFWDWYYFRLPLKIFKNCITYKYLCVHLIEEMDGRTTNLREFSPRRLGARCGEHSRCQNPPLWTTGTKTTIQNSPLWKVDYDHGKSFKLATSYIIPCKVSRGAARDFITTITFQKPTSERPATLRLSRNSKALFVQTLRTNISIIKTSLAFPNTLLLELRVFLKVNRSIFFRKTHDIEALISVAAMENLPVKMWRHRTRKLLMSISILHLGCTITCQ